MLAILVCCKSRGGESLQKKPNELIHFVIKHTAFLLSLIPLPALSQTSYSVFTYPVPVPNSNSNLTFALNLPPDSGDLFFHLSGPSRYSWIAIGFGSEMKDSLMFVEYVSADGKSTSCFMLWCYFIIIRGADVAVAVLL